MELKVTPHLLREKARELEESFQDAEKNCRRLFELSETTDTLMMGKCGEILRQRIRERQTELEGKISLLEKTFTQLYELADEYEKAEKENYDGAVGNQDSI